MMYFLSIGNLWMEEFKVIMERLSEYVSNENGKKILGSNIKFFSMMGIQLILVLRKLNGRDYLTR